MSDEWCKLNLYGAYFSLLDPLASPAVDPKAWTAETIRAVEKEYDLVTRIVDACHGTPETGTKVLADFYKRRYKFKEAIPARRSRSSSIAKSIPSKRMPSFSLISE